MGRPQQRCDGGWGAPALRSRRGDWHDSAFVGTRSFTEGVRGSALAQLVRSVHRWRSSPLRKPVIAANVNRALCASQPLRLVHERGTDEIVAIIGSPADAGESD